MVVQWEIQSEQMLHCESRKAGLCSDVKVDQSTLR